MIFKKTISFILCAVMFCTVFTSFAACNFGDDTPSGTTAAITTSPHGSDTTVGNAETTGDVTTSAQTTEPSQTGGQNTESTPSETTGEQPIETTPSAEGTQKPVTPTVTSGRFKMETGTSLDFYLDWEIKGVEDGCVVVEVDVVLATYQLYISARKNLGIITFNGETVRFSTDKIEQIENKKIELVIHSEELKIKPQGDPAVIDIKVEWFFNGSYSDVEFEWLEAGGIIPIS